MRFTFLTRQSILVLYHTDDEAFKRKFALAIPAIKSFVPLLRSFITNVLNCIPSMIEISTTETIKH